MKKLIYISLVVIALFFMQSCVDYLDKDISVDTKLTYEQIFADVHYAPGFLNNAYNQLPDGYSRFGGALLAAASDEGVCSNSGSPINLFNKNAINATTNPDDVWDAMYRGIRKCNIFLKECGPDGIITRTNSIPENTDGLAVRDYYKGQALFFRAYFHAEIMKYWGRIPYFDFVITGNDGDFKLPRPATYKECAMRADADFAAAADCPYLFCLRPP